MPKLTKQQAAFGSGIAITPTVVLSRFEVLAKGIPKDQWINSEVLCEFARKHASHCYVPETFLYQLKQPTIYDGEPACFSLVDGKVIPEPTPLRELEEAEYGTA
jgi:hypothetical protein